MVFQGPWIILGDFNEVKFSHESKGCQFSHQRADIFATSLGDSGLFDLKTIGRRFSWYRRMKNYVDVAKKHDRVCINSSWLSIFPEADAEVLNRLQSDHCPILSWWSGNRGIHGKLSEVQKNSLEFNSKKEQQLLDDYNNTLVQEELLWFQKSREQWVRFVDRNTRFFHIQTLAQRKHNKIHGLFLKDRVWKTDPEVLSQEAESFYKSLFCHLDDVDLGCLALGPDEFQAFFFKEYWEIIGLDVWKIVKPISLCNVVYKIITKVLVNRLHPHLVEIVGPLQGGFIPGRETPNNIIIVQEVLYFMKKTKSKKGTLAFKIDLEKAYNRVDWRFLAHTLKSFDFPIPTINLIMNCVTASSLSILWNGNRLNGFTPSRGLRQGDPMSPYLFVLCMERLACFISHHVDLGLWEPIAISRGGPRISHLMFVDDLLLFCKATKRQVQNMMLVLATFCKVSGMKINVEKSKALCSKNISATRK
ncbi:uncharacterized protein LOC110281546 [Arachis duranensis]|uniref:Uncharacterized protein LOC110281546 n=1 Tax=Arachis duranensis TaxID=130453 RepID=A0A6P5NXF3_ARADU|nr:uncharacterized protein LOC110281546 [Arachis duranensis]